MPRTFHRLALLSLVALACDPPDDVPADGPDEDATPRLAGALDPGEPQTMLIRYWLGPTMRGSATLIAPNVLVSNAHATFGGADGMYVQRGTTTTAGADWFQVAEKLHHPDFVNTGDAHDIALLRLACNIDDIAPAPINRTAIVDPDIGSAIKAVGYGPTASGLQDWGTRRSAGGGLTGYNSDWIFVSGVSAVAGDSGGSTYGYPSGIFGPGDDAGDADAVVPVRKLIGVLTFADGKSLRVDRHAAWIDDVVDGWLDPDLPNQPEARPIQQTSPAKYCPQGTTPGHYSIPNPEPGVTYTWTGVQASVNGSGTGTSVTASPSGTGAFTLKVTAAIPEGCARSFQATFVPLTSPCVDDDQ